MLTLNGPHTLETEVKKSRFIANAAQVDTVEDAMAYLDQVKAVDASHNCWAYKIGNLYRFSDDGEPGGSAGRPILAALEGQGVDNVIVVVTRYFGGTKLGVGGLVRAYGGAAAECLRTAEKKQVLPTVDATVTCGFDQIGTVYPLLETYNVQKHSEDYAQNGVVFSVTLFEHDLKPFTQAVTDATRGSGQVKKTSEPPLPK